MRAARFLGLALWLIALAALAFVVQRTLVVSRDLRSFMPPAQTADQKLLPYRFLLSPTLDNAKFDADYLRDQLQQRVEDLASPAGALLEPLLARDPTGEILVLAQRWTPAHTPRLCAGVWCDSKGAALLLVETRAAAFDPGAQEAAINGLRAAYSKLPHAGDAELI